MFSAQADATRCILIIDSVVSKYESSVLNFASTEELEYFISIIWPQLAWALLPNIHYGKLGIVNTELTPVVRIGLTHLLGSRPTHTSPG